MANTENRDLFCTFKGCGNRWVVDILHGRVCSEHDAMLSRQTMATPPTGYRQQTIASLLALQLAKPAAPHWTDTERDDDGLVPFDTPDMESENGSPRNLG